MTRNPRIDAMTWSGRCGLAAAAKGVLNALDTLHDAYAGPDSKASIFRKMRAILLEGLSKLSVRRTARLTASENLLLCTTMSAALSAAQADHEDSAVLELQRLRGAMPAPSFGRKPRERAIDFVVRYFLGKNELLVPFVQAAARGSQIEAA
jgi:hypothetical protein